MKRNKANPANPFAGIENYEVKAASAPPPVPPSQASTKVVGGRVLRSEARALKKWATEYSTSPNAIIGVLVRLFLNDKDLQSQVAAALIAADEDAAIARATQLLRNEKIRRKVLAELAKE